MLEELESKAAGLRVAMATLQEDLTAIELQIQGAEMTRYETGRCPEPRWWRAVKYARRIKGAHHQRVQQELAEVLKQIKELHHKTRGREPLQAFVDTAREMLPREMFQLIWQQALRRVDMNPATPAGHPGPTEGEAS